MIWIIGGQNDIQSQRMELGSGTEQTHHYEC
jgi:hypothetical protein